MNHRLGLSWGRERLGLHSRLMAALLPLFGILSFVALPLQNYLAT